MTPDSFSQYLREINEYELLDAADEVRLAQTIEAGNVAAASGAPFSAADRRKIAKGERASDEFYCANLRLVVSIARGYQRPPTVELADLVQEGNIGLHRAVELFDWRKGFKFSTYGTWWIRQTIGRSVARTGRQITLPVRQGEDLAKAIATAGGDTNLLTPEMRRLWLLSRPISMSSLLPDGGGSGNSRTMEDLLPADIVPVDIAGIRQADPEAGLEMLRRLPKATREVVEQRLCLTVSTVPPEGVPVPLRILAERMGLSREAIRKRYTAGLKQLRHLEDEHRGDAREFRHCDDSSCRFNTSE